MSLTIPISYFQNEGMRSLGKNVLPLSSVCNAKCLFCSNRMNPFPIHRCGFRPFKEVSEQLFQNMRNLGPHVEIRLSDAMPGSISEGEATLHPQFFKICKLIRQQLPTNPLHITTNGALLTEEFISKMAELKPFHLCISYHSTNVDHWTKIYGMNEKQFDIATNAWQLCKDAGLCLSGAIVALPNLVGYEDLKETMLFMNSFSPFGLVLWEPGYSKLADAEMLELMTVDHEEFKAFAYEMYEACDNVAITWEKDPNRSLRIQPYNYMVDSMRERIYRKVMWLTGEAAYDRLVKLVAHDNQFFPNEHYVHKVINHTYGGNIDCNGLLLIDDLRKAVYEVRLISEPDLIIIPNNMLDNFGNDMTGVHYTDVTHIPTWWRD